MSVGGGKKPKGPSSASSIFLNVSLLPWLLASASATLAEDSVVRMLATKADLLANSEAERHSIPGTVAFLSRYLCRESFDPGGRPRFPMLNLLCFLDHAHWMQITVFFGSRVLDANPLLIAKLPDDVRSAVTNRPRRVLEMDFGARDEAISQELTEGGGFL